MRKFVYFFSKFVYFSWKAAFSDRLIGFSDCFTSVRDGKTRRGGLSLPSL